VLVAPVALALLAAIWIIGRVVVRTNFRATRVMLASMPIVLGVVTLSWWWAAVGAVLAVLFLTTHRPETDDHLLLKQVYPNVAAFLLSPRRRGRL
jgi:hypothetical protein